jgi:hypothetical protein
MPGRKWKRKDGTFVICSIKDCSNNASSRGWCSKHHKRWLAHKDPIKMEIGERGKGTIFNGYRMFHIKDKKLFEHRIIMEEILGRKLKSNEIVHHIDENRLNNHPSNLQVMIRNQHIGMHTITTFRDKTHKQCTNCKIIKPRHHFNKEFYKNPTKFQDVNQARCKICKYILDKRYQHRPFVLNYKKIHNLK